ncbi:MAG TPA: homocysteine S-methyltransferase family protein [Alphaproteobacteria bacterium]|nr:homocysteine S-methyltransferase family protein [Alphaproteobacteria bacterium]
MTQYNALKQRIDRGEVIILDGAVGTQLQEMGLPIYHTAWAATALHTHPATVQVMHENYVKAGVDIITTNTYASARHNLEPLGLGELTGELNRRAVLLAREARDRAGGGRPVLIAGSISNFGMTTDGEDMASLRQRSRFTEEQLRANLREQAELLVEAGADFLLAESTGTNTHRKWVSDACKATGAPFWVGFKCHREPNEAVVKTGYLSSDRFVDVLDDVMSHGGSVLSIFHTGVDDTTAALKIAFEKWPGPIGVYPDAERQDYMTVAHDHAVENRISREEFASQARQWVESGVQIIGGCCGYGLPYIRPLREALPSKIRAPRQAMR